MPYLAFAPDRSVQFLLSIQGRSAALLRIRSLWGSLAPLFFRENLAGHGQVFELVTLYWFSVKWNFRLATLASD